MARTLSALQKIALSYFGERLNESTAIQTNITSLYFYVSKKYKKCAHRENLKKGNLKKSMDGLVRDGFIKVIPPQPGDEKKPTIYELTPIGRIVVADLKIEGTIMPPATDVFWTKD